MAQSILQAPRNYTVFSNFQLQSNGARLAPVPASDQGGASHHDLVTVGATPAESLEQLGMDRALRTLSFAGGSARKAS